MGGGLLTLVARGLPDVYFTGDPQVSYFKATYRRCTAFSIMDHEIKFDGRPNFGDEKRVKIPFVADLLQRLALVVDIEPPIIKFPDAIFKQVLDILARCGVTLAEPPYNENQTVSFEDIFINNTVVPQALTDFAFQYNQDYDRVLEYLKMMDARFSMVNDPMAKRMIAVRADDVVVTGDGLGSKPIDRLGYLVLTYPATFNEYLFSSFNLPVVISNGEASDSLTFIARDRQYLRLFPREIGSYIELTETNYTDYIFPNPIPADSRYYLLISQDGYNNTKRYDITRASSNFGIPDLVLGKYEFGFLVIPTVPGLTTDEEYEEYIFSLIDAAPRYTEFPLSSFMFDQTTGMMERYEINDTALITKTFNGSTDGLIKDIDGNPEKYFLINIAENANINDTLVLSGQTVQVDYHDMVNNADPAIPTFYLKQNNKVNRVRDNQTGLQVRNQANNVEVLVRVFPPIFEMDDPPLNNMDRFIFPGDIALHPEINKFLLKYCEYMIAFLDDLLDYNNYYYTFIIPSFCLSYDNRLYNFDGIFIQIFRLLIKKTIYVQMLKLNDNYENLFAMYYSTPTEANSLYHVVKSDTDTMDDIKVIYRLAKFVLWSYHFEYLFSRNYTTGSIEYLNRISVYVPIGVWRSSTYDIYRTIRYTRADILSINDSYVYEENSIVDDDEQNETLNDDNDGLNVETKPVMYPGKDISWVPQQNDTVYYDGISTCTNREVEFLNIFAGRNYQQFIASTKITEYFENIVISYYQNIYDVNDRRFEYLLSYNLMTIFLKYFYENAIIGDLTITLEKLVKIVTDFLRTEYLKTLIIWNEAFYLLWRNMYFIEMYTDSSFIPRLSSGKIPRYFDDTSVTTQQYLDSVFGTGVVEPYQTIMERSRYYCGINTNYRPRILYCYGYNFVVGDVTTYDLILATLIDANGFLNDSIERLKSYNNQSINPIINQTYYNVGIMKENMRDKFLNDLILVNSMSPVYWYALSRGITIMPTIVPQLINSYPSAEITYNGLTYPINYLPISLIYYYCLYMSYMINFTTNYPEDINRLEINVVFTLDDILPVFAPDGGVGDDGAFPRNYSYFLSFYPGLPSSTNLVNPRCPIHYYYYYSGANNKTSLFTDYYFGNLSYSPQDIVCPSCLMVYMQSAVMTIAIGCSFLQMNPSIGPVENGDRSTIDAKYIYEKLSVINSSYSKIAYLFRHEGIHYDEVTQTAYRIPLDFCLVRLALAYKRYEQLITRIVNLSSSDYNTFIANLYIGVIQGNFFDDFTRDTNYTQYTNWLAFARTNFQNNNNFKNKIDQVISWICLTEHDPARTADLLNRLERPIGSYVPKNRIDYEVDGVMNFQRNIGMMPDHNGTLWLFPSYYRGNVSAYRSLYKNSIDQYNVYMNCFFKQNIAENKKYDILDELTKITIKNIPSQYQVGSDTDYYRYAQDSLDIELIGINDYGASDNFLRITAMCPMKRTFVETSTTMINHVRNYQIYYDMLVARAQKRYFLFSPLYRTYENIIDLYYESRENIVNTYSEQCIEAINNLNNYKEPFGQDQYEPDSAREYFIDKEIFTTDPTRNYLDKVYVTDYLNFNPLNTYHLRQVFSETQKTYLLGRMGSYSDYVYIVSLSSGQYVYGQYQNNNILSDDIYELTADFKTIMDIIYSTNEGSQFAVPPAYLALYLLYNSESANIQNFFRTTNLNNFMNKIVSEANDLGYNPDQYIVDTFHNIYRVYYNLFGARKTIQYKTSIIINEQKITDITNKYLEIYKSDTQNFIDGLIDSLTYQQNVFEMKTDMGQEFLDVLILPRPFASFGVDDEVILLFQAAYANILNEFQSQLIIDSINSPNIQTIYENLIIGMTNNVEQYIAQVFDDYTTLLINSPQNVLYGPSGIDDGQFSGRTNWNGVGLITPRFLYNYYGRSALRNYSDMVSALEFMLLYLIDLLTGYQDDMLDGTSQDNIPAETPETAYTRYIDYWVSRLDQSYIKCLIYPPDYQTSDFPQYTHNNQPYYQYDLTKIVVRNVMGIDSSISNSTYYNSTTYNRLYQLLVKNSYPVNAWTRYLGYRLIEKAELIIDGQVIDSGDSDLLLALHQLYDKKNHKRGIDEMIGHTENFYAIDRQTKPQRKTRLYIDLNFLWINRFSQSVLYLVGMLHSTIQINIKFRDLDDLLYVEEGAQLVRKPKINAHILGCFVYLEPEERKKYATTKIESLMERYHQSYSVNRSQYDVLDRDITGHTNILRNKYQFNDPCKFFLYRFTVQANQHPTDKLFWDITGIPQRDENQIILPEKEPFKLIEQMIVEFNGRVREAWKDIEYYQIMQPRDGLVNPLPRDSGLYRCCLYVGQQQPSGATNLTQIGYVEMGVTLSDQAMKILEGGGIIRWKTWCCTHNIMVTMSGFSALLFFSSHVN